MSVLRAVQQTSQATIRSRAVRKTHLPQGAPLMRDVMTGLPNQGQFNLDVAKYDFERRVTTQAFLYLDFRKFVQIFDNLNNGSRQGQEMTGKLLVEFAERAEPIFSKYGLKLYRYDDEKFAVLGRRSANDVEAACQEMAQVFSLQNISFEVKPRDLSPDGQEHLIGYLGNRDRNRPLKGNWTSSTLAPYERMRVNIRNLGRYSENHGLPSVGVSIDYKVAPAHDPRISKRETNETTVSTVPFRGHPLNYVEGERRQRLLHLGRSTEHRETHYNLMELRLKIFRDLGKQYSRRVARVAARLIGKKMAKLRIDEVRKVARILDRPIQDIKETELAKLLGITPDEVFQLKKKMLFAARVNSVIERVNSVLKFVSTLLGLNLVYGLLKIIFQPMKESRVSRPV